MLTAYQLVCRTIMSSVKKSLKISLGVEAAAASGESFWPKLFSDFASIQKVAGKTVKKWGQQEKGKNKCHRKEGTGIKESKITCALNILRASFLLLRRGDVHPGDRGCRLVILFVGCHGNSERLLLCGKPRIKNKFESKTNEHLKISEQNKRKMQVLTASGDS